MGSGYPVERIATDIRGELSETNKGKKYILVVADYYVLLYPISIFLLRYSFTLYNDGISVLHTRNDMPLPRLID